MLRDDMEGKGNSFEFLGVAGEVPKAITKEQRSKIRLVFELPSKIKTMYLALPAAAFRVNGPMIGYKFSKSDIKEEGSKPAESKSTGESAK